MKFIFTIVFSLFALQTWSQTDTADVQQEVLRVYYSPSDSLLSIDSSQTNLLVLFKLSIGDSVFGKVEYGRWGDIECNLNADVNLHHDSLSIKVSSHYSNYDKCRGQIDFADSIWGTFLGEHTYLIKRRLDGRIKVLGDHGKLCFILEPYTVANK